MKIHRLLAAVLLALVTSVASAQDNGEITALRAKAEKGNGIAQYNLGLAYAEGRGVTADPLEAYVWLSLARENGMRGRALDNLVASLDKPTLEAAQQKLTDRKNRMGIKPTARVEPAPAAAPAPAAPPAETKPAPAADPVVALTADKKQLSAEVAQSWKEIEGLKAELARTKQALTTLQQAPKPAPDTAALDQKTRELQAAAAELEASRSFGRKVEDNLNKVTDQKTALAAQLAAATADTARARQDATDLRTQQADLTARLAAANSSSAGTVAALQAEITRLQQPTAAKYPDLSGRVQELETAVAAAQTNAASLTAERDAARSAQNESRGTIAKLEQDKAALVAAQGASAETSRQLAAAADRAAVTEKQGLALRQEREALSGRVNDLTGEVAQLRADRERMQKLLADSGQKMRDTTVAATRIKELETQAVQLQGSLSAQAAELSAAVAAKTDAVAQAGSLAAERDAARAAQGELRGTIAGLEQEKAQLAASVASARQPDGRLEQAVSRNDSLEKELKAEAAHRSTAEASLAEANDKLAALTAEAGRAKQEAIALTTAKLEAEHAVAVASSSQSELKATIGRLEQEKAQLAAKPSAPAYPDLSDKVHELEASMADSARQLVAAESAQAGLKQQLADAQQNNARAKAADEAPQLRRERDDLTGRVAGLTTEVAQLRGDRERMQKLLSDAGKQVRDSTADAARIKELETQSTRLQNSLAAQKAAPAYPDLSGRVHDLEARLAASSQSLESAKAESAAASQQVAQLQAALAAKPAAPAYPDLSGKVSELEAAVTAANESSKRATDAAQAAATRSTQGEADLAAATAEVARLKTNVADMSAELAHARAAARNPATPSYPDLSAKVGELQSAVADSARQLVAAEAAQAGLKQQLAAAQQDAAKAKAGDESAPLRHERDELTTRVTALSGEVTQLRGDRERMQKLLSDAGKQVRDSTADAGRIKELETKAAALQNALASTQGQIGGLQDSLAAAQKAKPAYPDLSDKVSSLESQVASLQSTLAAKPTAPTYPDLSGRVAELETQLASATSRNAAPAYPNLSGRVGELEASLADTRRQLADLRSAPPVAAAPVATAAAEPSDLQKQLAETQDKLTTVLRGYALLQKETDDAAAKAGQATEAVTTERNNLATQVTALTGEVAQLKAGAQSQAGSSQAEITRLNESLVALQRSTAQNTTDLAATRAVLQQVQGANRTLATENYDLKTRLAGGGGTIAPATVTPVPVPLAAPAARTYVVAAGDSLSRISQRYYGNANRWQEIYTANRDKIGSDGVLRVGAELRIP